MNSVYKTPFCPRCRYPANDSSSICAECGGTLNQATNPHFAEIDPELGNRILFAALLLVSAITIQSVVLAWGLYGAISSYWASTLVTLAVAVAATVISLAAFATFPLRTYSVAVISLCLFAAPAVWLLGGRDFTATSGDTWLADWSMAILRSIFAFCPSLAGLWLLFRVTESTQDNKTQTWFIVFAAAVVFSAVSIPFFLTMSYLMCVFSLGYVVVLPIQAVLTVVSAIGFGANLAQCISGSSGVAVSANSDPSD